MYCKYCGRELMEGEVCNCRQPSKKKSVIPIVIAAIVIAVLVGGGAIAAITFFLLSDKAVTNELRDDDNEPVFADRDEETEEEEDTRKDEEEQDDARENEEEQDFLGVKKISEKYEAGKLNYAQTKKALSELDTDDLSEEDMDLFLELTDRLETDLADEMEQLAGALDYTSLLETLKAYEEELADDRMVDSLLEQYETDYLLYLQNESNQLLDKGETDEAVRLLSDARKVLPDSEVLDDLLEKAEAAPEEGVHEYEYIVKDCTWKEASKDCIDRGGYLVQINSEEEYAHIVEEIEDKDLEKIIFFVGGRRESGSYNYYWIDSDGKYVGEALNDSGTWCSDCWLDGEPSFEDQNIKEDCMSMFYFREDDKWVWNDIPSNILKAVPTYASKIGYICEYPDK